MERRIAEHLLRIHAVELRPHDPFTWTSGIRSPIYCDNRQTISYPDVRADIANGFVDILREHYPTVEVIAGTATAGIPHAAWVAHKLHAPMIYVRSQPKAHGKGSQIEGKLSPGQKVVVIEDLVSTGGSSINAVKAVEREGGEVLGVCAIFTYGLPKAEQAFASSGIALHTLSNYSTLIEVAQEKGVISAQDAEVLSDWRNDPENYYNK